MDDKFTFEEYADIIVRAYEYVYCKMNSYDDYSCTPSPTDISAVNNFINHIQSEHHKDNVEYVLSFIETSFSYYAKSTKKYRFGLRSVQLSWIIGKPAILRQKYLDENYSGFPSFLKFIRTKVKASLYDKFSEEVGRGIKIISKTYYTKLNQNEETFKKMCNDDQYILEHCITGTFLYNHKSNICVFCNKRDDCKNTLQRVYPKIYKNRGYE